MMGLDDLVLELPSEGQAAGTGMGRTVRAPGRPSYPPCSPSWVNEVHIAIAEQAQPADRLGPLTLLATPLALLQPIPLKIVVSVLGNEPLTGMLAEIAPIDDAGLLILSAALVLIIAVAQLAQYLGTWLLSAWVGERLVLLFRNGLFRHMQRMSVAYHDRRGVADLSFRIQYDANSIQDVLIDGLIPLVGYIVTVIAMIYVIALIDVRLATIALVVAPVMFLLARQSRRPLRRRWDRVFAARSGAMSVVQEVLGSMRVVKAFGQERREETRFSARSFDAAKSHMLAIAAEGGVKLMLGVTGAVGTALVLVVGVFAVQAGTLTLGELLVVMAYLLMLYEPLREISPKIADIQSSLSNAERSFTILDEAPDVEEAAKPRAIERWSAVIAPSGSRTAA